jgi:hypothetical protein
MSDDRKLRALPPTPPAPPVEAPRGRLISAEGIVRRFYLDAETSEAIVDARWVRDNMPYKQRLSHSRVAWFDADVEAIIAEARRSGKLIKDVRLDYLERRAS